MRKKNKTQPALLVADGGSTKTDWCLLTPETGRIHFRTRGLNPVMLGLRELCGILQTELLPPLASHLQISGRDLSVHHYGAGCLPSVCRKMEEAITTTVPNSSARIYSDLLGAARALCGHEAGIACILGTGSNSCRYDGTNIIQHVPSLGYILGDEGSGTALGKRLIADWLKGLLAPELTRLLNENTGWNETDIIRKVYREQEANRFLASFTPFLAAHRTHPDIHRILTDCFRAFFERNILAYRSEQLPVHFVGSIATIFHEELEQTAETYSIKIGLILQDPITRIADFHLQEADNNDRMKTF